MSHFYGVLNGLAGRATRCGTKNSGMDATAASWDGAIVVSLRFNEETGKNEFRVLEVRWHGRGRDRVIAEGVVGDE